MKTLDVAELSRLPEELKSGETIELVDGGKVGSVLEQLLADREED